MTELKLYRFINENDIEWHRHDNNGTDDVIILPNFYQIEEFNKIVSSDIFEEEGIECRMKDGYFAIWMKDICEYHGIELDEVFKGGY